jgi:hypothetical protein
MVHSDARVILPRRHLRHEGERVAFGVRAAETRFLPLLPADHFLESLVERLSSPVGVTQYWQ